MANEPATIWNPKDGNGEYTTGSVNTLVDAINNTLVDVSGNSLVDNGVTFTQTPATVWVTDDSQ